MRRGKVAALTDALETMRGKRSTATSMMNLAIIAYQLGEENEWVIIVLKDSTTDMDLIKTLIKEMKVTLEFGIAKVAVSFSRMDPTDPSNACQIASGIELLKELGSPDVLQDCRNFYSALHSYLKLCPKMESPKRTKHPELHWWWKMAIDTPTRKDIPSSYLKEVTNTEDVFKEKDLSIYLNELATDITDKMHHPMFKVAVLSVLVGIGISMAVQLLMNAHFEKRGWGESPADLIRIFSNSYEIPASSIETGKNINGWLQAEDYSKCVSSRGLSSEEYKLFISQFSDMMKLPDTSRDQLLHAAGSSKSVHALEAFSNGLEGNYSYFKYAVVRHKNLYDVTIAVHLEQWDLHHEDAKRKLMEGIDDKKLTVLENEQIHAMAEAFATVNKKAAITQKEMEIWMEYFHNKAMQKFHQNCVEELLTDLRM